MRRFRLMRYEDPTGVSGIGVVAHGVEFPDGSVAVRWPGAHASTTVWPSVDSVRAIHGHNGSTEIQWIDFRGGRPSEDGLDARLAFSDWP